MSSDDELAELTALVARVDALAESVASRRSADLECKRGCSACCRVSLTVSGVESARVERHLTAAMDADGRARLAARAETAASAGACVMLDEDGSCAIYPARPLVCRTQGLPLRYPDGVVPAGAVMARASGGTGGELTWCPLNFTVRKPEGADVVDAERIDLVLAVVNRRYCERNGLDPLERKSLTASVLTCQFADLTLKY